MTPDEADRIRNQPGWWDKRRTLADAVRCLTGAHRTVLDGSDDGLRIERCSCGATRLGGRLWLREAWWSPPRQGWTDPVAEVRRRREQDERLEAQWAAIWERFHPPSVPPK